MLTRRSLLKSGTAGVAVLAMPNIVRAQQRKILRLIPESDLAILDPVFTTAGITVHHGYAVFDTLYGTDETFAVRPQMVEGHDTSADGLTWTLTLRDGLRFHDGSPVLGRDVVASINRWGARDAFGQTLLSVTEKLSAPTDKTIVFRLTRPFPMLPNALGKASPNMPAIMPERLALTNPATQVTEMIGSGPFRFIAKEWVSGSRVVYEKFADYVPRREPASFTAGGKVAHVDRVEWLIIPDAATAGAAMMAGEADVWHNAQPDFIPMLESTGKLRVEAGILPPTTMLRFNQLQPPFDNPAVRRALLPAINQAEIMTAMRGTDPSRWQTGIGFFHPSSPMVTKAGMEALTGPRDIKAAKAALVAAGYDGRPVVVMDPLDQEHLHSATLVVAKTLEQIGFKVDLQTMDWGTLVQRRSNKGPMSEGGWNMFITGLNDMTAFDPSTNIALRGNGKEAYAGWPTSERIEGLRQKWLYASDMAEQKAIAEAIQLVAFEELPYIPLGAPNGFVAMSKRVKNFPREFPRFYNVDLI